MRYRFGLIVFCLVTFLGWGSRPAEAIIATTCVKCGSGCTTSSTIMCPQVYDNTFTCKIVSGTCTKVAVGENEPTATMTPKPTATMTPKPNPGVVCGWCDSNCSVLDMWSADRCNDNTAVDGLDCKYTGRTASGCEAVGPGVPEAPTVTPTKAVSATPTTAKYPIPLSSLDTMYGFYDLQGQLKTYVTKGDRVWHYVCANGVCNATYTKTLADYFKDLGGQTAAWGSNPIPTSGLNTMNGFYDAQNQLKTYVTKGNRVWYYACANGTCNAVYTKTLSEYFGGLGNQTEAWGSNAIPTINLDAMYAFYDPQGQLKSYVIKGDRVWYYACVGGTCNAVYTKTLSELFAGLGNQNSVWGTYSVPTSNIDAMYGFYDPQGQLKTYIIKGDRIWYYACINGTCNAGYTKSLGEAFTSVGNQENVWGTNTLTATNTPIPSPTATTTPATPPTATPVPVNNPVPVLNLDTMYGFYNPSKQLKTYIVKGDRVWHYVCANGVCSASYTKTLAEFFKELGNQAAAWGSNPIPTTGLDAAYAFYDPQGQLKSYVFKGDRVWYYACTNTTCNAGYTKTLSDYFKDLGNQEASWGSNPIPTTGLDAAYAFYDPQGQLKSYIIKGDRVWNYACGGGICNAVYTKTLAEFFKDLGNQGANWGSNPIPTNGLSAAYAFYDPEGQLKAYVVKGNRIWYYACVNGTCNAGYTKLLTEAFLSIEKQTEVWGPVNGVENRCPLKASGDADCNGVIDMEDFKVWKTEYLSSTGKSSDFSGDGLVGLEDFTFWKNGYLGPTQPAVSVVPTEIELQLTPTLIPQAGKLTPTNGMGINPPPADVY